MSIISWVGQKIGLTNGKFWSAFFGGETWAGEPVTHDTAMQLGAFWACLRLNARTISTLPLGRSVTMASTPSKIENPAPATKIPTAASSSMKKRA